MDRAQFAAATADLGHSLIGGAEVWSEALAVLDRFVGGDVLSISSMTFAERASADLVTRGTTPLSDEELELWPELVGTHPYVPRLLTGPLEASRLTDTVPIRVFEQTELYQSLLRPHGNRFQAGLVLRRDRRSMLLASVWRADADFSDAEMWRLEQLRSVLAAALAFRAACDRLASGPPPTDPVAGLTARQQQVAALVASGLTNDQVARRLSITPRTVRKHLGDLFERTGTDSRTALTAWWRQGG